MKTRASPPIRGSMGRSVSLLLEGFVRTYDPTHPQTFKRPLKSLCVGALETTLLGVRSRLEDAWEMPTGEPEHLLVFVEKQSALRLESWLTVVLTRSTKGAIRSEKRRVLLASHRGA